MAWWTKITGKVEKHDTKIQAGIALNFARAFGIATVEEMALYRRDPVKYPDEQDVLPEERRRIEKRVAKRKG